MLRKSKMFVFVIFVGLIQPLFAQQDIIKDYADTSSVKDYCFYPSTLRMLNIAKDQDYYNMVEDIEKLLVYSLDSASVAESSYKKMLAMYRKNNFEEYAVMEGGETNFSIYGKDGRKNEFAGVFRVKKKVYVFYMIGNIGWQKIPALVQNFSKGDMFNLFDLTKSNAR